MSAALDVLLRSRELIVDQAERMLQAQRKFMAAEADFADCLIERIARHAACTSVVTFDAKAAKSAGMTLLG